MSATDQPANQAANEAEEFLRMPSVLRWTGLARSTIYQLIADKAFPEQVRLARRAVGWRRSDLTRWSANRRSSAELRLEPQVPNPSTAVRTKLKGRRSTS